MAVVAFAQADNLRRESHRNEVETLMPVFAEVFGNGGITKDDIDFICSGSTDYLVGGPFSFVGRPRRHRRLAAAEREPRGDGRRLGPLRGVGGPAGRGGRHRPGLRLRQVVAGRARQDPRPPARPVRAWRRCGPTRCRWPPCRPGR